MSENVPACHQSDGLGKQGVFPPLRGSQWIKKDPKLVASIIQYGLGGEIDGRCHISIRHATTRPIRTRSILWLPMFDLPCKPRTRLFHRYDQIHRREKRGTIYGQAELEEMFQVWLLDVAEKI